MQRPHRLASLVYTRPNVRARLTIVVVNVVGACEFSFARAHFCDLATAAAAMRRNASGRCARVFLHLRVERFVRLVLITTRASFASSSARLAFHAEFFLLANKRKFACV